MSLGSNLVTLLPKWMLTDEQTQYWGLLLFVLGVVLFMAGNFLEGLLKEATDPKLAWDNLRTNFKPIHVKGEKIEELDFAYIDIHNKPQNLANGKTALSVRAEITCKSKDGVKQNIKYGRWCDQESPLLNPPDDLTIKNADIESGGVSSLVLVFKKTHGKDVFAFHCSDHKRLGSTQKIRELCKERKIGRPPIEIEIKLHGNFYAKPIIGILDIDEKEDFVIREIKRK